MQLFAGETSHKIDNYYVSWVKTVHVTRNVRTGIIFFF